MTPARKLGPALIAGNAVLLKPASQTPLIALWLAGLLAEAGLPEGVLQVVTGRDREISAALLAGPDAVTFTGSTEVGGYLRRALAERNVRLQTRDRRQERLRRARRRRPRHGRGHGRQRRVRPGGPALHRDQPADRRRFRGPALTSKLRAQVAEIVLGPGLDPATTLGPLCYAAHRDGVLEHIERARAEGASVIAGGGRPAAAALAHGCYVEPTLISVTPEQSLWRDEVFGPVLAVTPAAGFDDAVRLANDSVYGLSAAVFTTSLTSANKFIDLAEAGQVAVNLPTAGWDVHHPFGGFRDSGSPFKEQGARAPLLHPHQDGRREVRVVASGTGSKGGMDHIESARTPALPSASSGPGSSGWRSPGSWPRPGCPWSSSRRSRRSPPTRPGTTPASCTPGSTTRPARPRR